MTLTEPTPTSTSDVLAPELEEPYRRLLRVLRAGQGMFTLVPVESNLTEEKRGRLLDRLQRDLTEEGLSLCEVELTYSDWDPVEVLEKKLGPMSGESFVLLLSGLESTPTGRLSADGIARPPAFLRLNQARELLAQSYPAPTIVWCEPYTYGTLRRHAPDFFDHFTGLVRFPLPRLSPPVEAGGGLEFQVEETGWESRESLPSAAAVRFYEQRLDNPSLDDEGRVRALLGLAEALVELRRTEGIAALERAAECAERAKAKLLPEMDLESWGRAHRLLARAYWELGQWKEGLSASEKAVKGYTALAVRNPASFRGDLAMSLHYQSNLLNEFGRHEQALRAMEKAVEIRRGLAQESPVAFGLDLVQSVNNLSLRLAALGRWTESLTANEEAVELCRDLAQERPTVFRPELARSLTNLSCRLREQWRWEESLAAIEEAVAIRRELAQERPATFRPSLALSLQNLSASLEVLGRRKAALAAIEEAVEIRRELAQERPDAFGPELARSLYALHLRLMKWPGREGAALAALQEALDLLEPHFRRFPVAHASLMGHVIDLYQRAAQACGVQHDEGRLRSIRQLLETGKAET